MIKLEYLSKISSVISEDIVSTTIVRRNSIIRPLSRRVGYLSESSFLGKRYENLFLYPLDIQDQSLVLSAGDYIVQCDSGYIDISFFSRVYAKDPYHLSLSEETEVFFLFSKDCVKPSIYKEFLVLPFVENFSVPNYLNFSYSEISSRLTQEAYRSIWMSRFRNYIDTIDSSKEIPYGSLFVGAVSAKLEFDTIYGWFFSYGHIDDGTTFLCDSDSCIGDYRSLDYLSEPYFQTADLVGIDISVLFSFYKDSDNFISLVILPNYMGALIGKNSGEEFRYSLCGMSNFSDTPIMMIDGDLISVGFQNQQFLFEISSLFRYEILYIGYDGVSNYLNNKISGVYL